MHTLIVSGLRSYFTHVHGPSTWMHLAKSAGYAADDFRFHLEKDDTVADTLLELGCDHLNRPRADLLEDFGLFLTSHSATGSIRRLMRFSGKDFMEFLLALPELAPRVHMAVPGLILPNISVDDLEGGFIVRIAAEMPGYDHVVMGGIRGMADDYGALVHMDLHEHQSDHHRHWAVWVIDPGFSEGRQFQLINGVGV